MSPYEIQQLKDLKIFVQTGDLDKFFNKSYDI